MRTFKGLTLAQWRGIGSVPRIDGMPTQARSQSDATFEL